MDELAGYADALLEQLFQDLLNASGETSRRAIAGYASSLEDEVLDPAVRGFVLTLANDTVDTDADWINAIATVVAGKAPSEWTDVDRAHFRHALARRVESFLRLVALHAEQRADGGGPFKPFRVTVTRPDGREHVALVGVDDKDQQMVSDILDTAMDQVVATVGSEKRGLSALIAMIAERVLPSEDAIDEDISSISPPPAREMPDAIRHICGISGGKDSSALAVYLRDTVPEMEYFFCDTGAELPETYEYLTRLQVILGKPIERLNATRGFDHWFEVFRGALPSPQMRWCTKNMKIKPIEEWIGNVPAVSYVAIRADESNRKGYISTKSNIQTRFPFVEDGIDRDGVMRILENAGIGLPKYYEWRTRSGCYFCFYQRKAEWIGLAERHPELFERAVAIEQKVLQDAGVAGDADFRDRAMRGGSTHGRAGDAHRAPGTESGDYRAARDGYDEGREEATESTPSAGPRRRPR